MNSEKPSFLTQPVVKNIFVYRNGDPFYEARRHVVNQRRVFNFDTFLREVTGGLQAPFGAVRNIYTPRMGHRVDSLEHLQSGKQYVAAGKERFKKLDYSQIGTKKKRMLQANSSQTKPVPQRRIIASARFLKPIKEPCTIFVVANGDVLNPALRVPIPQRMLSQYDRVLEMIMDKMSMRILGGVRSLYTFDGKHVNDGNDLENGQFYVAVGRDKLKRLPYSDLLFTKPKGMHRIITSKSSTLPPIYRYEKRNGNVCSSQQSTSMVACSEPAQIATCDEDHVTSFVRKISQQRLMILRNKTSCISLSLATQDNDCEQQAGPGSPGENGETSPWRHLPGEKPIEKDQSSGTDNGLEGKADNEESTVAENAAEEQGDNEGNKVSPRYREETSDPPKENQQTVDQIEETSEPVEENQESEKQAETSNPAKEDQISVDQIQKVDILK
ncbi:hypothetical protein UPYG_G00305360 [Umbra pygmaea]|uniref:Doublecortin domain-containing protein 2 n=1 Tax=Umbra pygmaea TaxID=75934 RepID=A0ABD0W0C8_UMBPY